MAEAIYLITKTEDSGTTGQSFINNVCAMVMNSDDGNTDDQIRAQAVTQAVAAGHPLPSNYFDTGDVTLISDLVAGPLKDDGDAYIMGLRSVIKVEG